MRVQVRGRANKGDFRLPGIAAGKLPFFCEASGISRSTDLGTKPLFANPRRNGKLRRDLPFMVRSAYSRHIGLSPAGGFARIAGASHGHGQSIRCGSRRARRRQTYVYRPCRGAWGVLITRGVLSIHKRGQLDCCRSFIFCCRGLSAWKFKLILGRNNHAVSNTVLQTLPLQTEPSTSVRILLSWVTADLFELGFVDKGYPLQDCDEIDEAEV